MVRLYLIGLSPTELQIAFQHLEMYPDYSDFSRRKSVDSDEPHFFFD
ncbi:MAG: hypothetical protein JXB50_15955 [Spirochaetes bacterium]|nr:hypothetical protein [Spirochaetota bacterium]